MIESGLNHALGVGSLFEPSKGPSAPSSNPLSSSESADGGRGGAPSLFLLFDLVI